MIKAVTGTKDILPLEIDKWYHIEKLIFEKMRSFNFKEIRTPVFEETGLFSRGIGQATDIVSKEMYTFLDRSETSITLRPEMTASVVRAFIEHSLDKKQPVNKLFYIAPMFRQERPQAGRLRQFHQFGLEIIGSPDASADAEIMIIAYDLLKDLGLTNLSVRINSLGIPESREKYKEVLRAFLLPNKDILSEDSRKRFDSNIMRIFDSKEEKDQELLEGAPLLIDYLDEESRLHYEAVKRHLITVGVKFEEDPRLVRGLDYYTKTAFEIVSGSVGSQSALCGGGRYDLLVEQLGGAQTPGVGFAAGIERILLACENEKSLLLKDEYLDIYVVRLEKELHEKVFEISNQLRRSRLSVEIDYLNRSVKAQMREANRLNAKSVLFVGGEEYLRGAVVLKNMSTGEQEEIALEEICKLIYKIEAASGLN